MYLAFQSFSELAVNSAARLQAAVTPEMLENEEFLKQIHHILLEVSSHVCLSVAAFLLCITYCSRCLHMSVCLSLPSCCASHTVRGVFTCLSVCRCLPAVHHILLEVAACLRTSVCLSLPSCRASLVAVACANPLLMAALRLLLCCVQFR